MSNATIPQSQTMCAARKKINSLFSLNRRMCHNIWNNSKYTKIIRFIAKIFSSIKIRISFEKYKYNITKACWNKIIRINYKTKTYKIWNWKIRFIQFINVLKKSHIDKRLLVNDEDTYFPAFPATDNTIKFIRRHKMFQFKSINLFEIRNIKSITF